MAMIGKGYTACGLASQLRSGYSANPIQMFDGTESIDLLSVFNPVGSGLIMRVYRVRWVNAGTAAVTVARMQRLEVWRTNAHFEGAVCPIVPWIWDRDPSPLKVFASSNATVTVTDLFMRSLVSLDEYAIGGYSIDETEGIPEWNALWSSGMESDDVQPIVCREGYGVTLRHSIPVQTADGPTSVDCWIDLTLSEV